MPVVAVAVALVMHSVASVRRYVCLSVCLCVSVIVCVCVSG